jgi:hypothetical protein
MLRLSRWCVVLLTVAGLSGETTRLHCQANDPNAGSDVVGRVIPPARDMEFVGIPPADREPTRVSLERLWNIALRNPALNPPQGFDLKQELTANGILPGPREPFLYRAAGYLHWYTFMPALNRVSRLDVAMHAFYLTANRPAMILADEWQIDEEGTMYFEPQEIRRVAGYPQYRSGMIALTDSSQPIWTPVPRERVLRRELAVARANLDAIGSASLAAAANNPGEQLRDWLRGRPSRQREADKMYEDTKRQNPLLAEKMKANFSKAEEETEKALRQVAERKSPEPPVVQARRQKERQDTEACIGYLEGELTRLSPADRMADAYVALPGGRPLPKAGCSALVEQGFPDALRIVAANPRFFDTKLPRTALQLIVLDVTNFEFASYPRSGWRRDVYERLREGMDYKAFAALLAKH